MKPYNPSCDSCHYDKVNDLWYCDQTDCECLRDLCPLPPEVLAVHDAADSAFKPRPFIEPVERGKYCEKCKHCMSIKPLWQRQGLTTHYEIDCDIKGKSVVYFIDECVGLFDPR